MRWLVVLVILSGCRSLLGFDELAAPDGGARPDTPADAPSDTNQFCAGTIATVCLPAAPTMDLLVEEGGTTLVEVSCTPDGACILGVRSLRVSGALVVTASEPTIPVTIVVSETFTVDANGVVDVGSRAGAPGPGARDCGGQTAPSGGGGGAGGSHSARGGEGGAGNVGTGGKPASALIPTRVTGGCSGQAGVGALPGGGGQGGGGLAIIANAMLVAGTIDASGQGGGGGGGISSGGGGGGSGGMIVLDSPSVDLTLTSKLTAKGGGGGGGSGTGASAAASDGSDGSTGSPSGAAAGGSGAEPGSGTGGPGGTLATGGNGGNSNARGGGGGGGGAGTIWIAAPALAKNGSIVPTPMLL